MTRHELTDERLQLARRAVLGATGLTALGGLSSGGVVAEDEGEENGNGGHDVHEIIDDWDQEPRGIAEETMDTYGDPDEVVPSRLIWHHDDGAPWKRTELFRDPVPHNFPKQHNDYLEQFIDYHVPPTMYSEVARYDGSVMLERTKGEISARCDIEEANFLAINLTHDLVTTDMTLVDARRQYGEDMMAFVEENEVSPRMEGLQFDPPEGDQRDPDVSVIQDGEVVVEEALGPEDEESGEN